MKKNIGIGVLITLLVASMAICTVFGQKLSSVNSKNISLTNQVNQSKKQISALQSAYSDLNKKKNNYIIDDLNTAVTKLYSDYLTFDTSTDNYAERRKDAQKYASQDVVNQLFSTSGPSSSSGVSSSTSSLKVFIENQQGTVVTALVSYNLDVKVAATIDRSNGYYDRVTYDSTSKQILSLDKIGQLSPLKN
ncbi:hypothetical protein [Lactococcus lactis]|uniref:hypothetical protein n=1 Tax=Lactococcus lactis TaxID=1358 RepID=UPI0028927CD9|nr:hypothetical protein [Lactococcus lactis]MDT2909274.1 hypothetical protein [Lactococcus lactis]MDT2925196.1 hypothetical protein [Lactococcus lactis]MDT2952055.1 hypothetical protein [Lactococcus lactis]